MGVAVDGVGVKVDGVVVTVGLVVGVDVTAGVPVTVGLVVGVDVMAGVAVGVEVAAVPETLISTHQDFVLPAPIPNGTPAEFRNFQ